MVILGGSKSLSSDAHIALSSDHRIPIIDHSLPNPFCIQAVTSLSLATPSPSLPQSQNPFHSNNNVPTPLKPPKSPNPPTMNHPTMSFSTSLFLVLLVTLCFTCCRASSGNATTIYEVLSQHGLPMGLFPKGVRDFAVANDGRFWVHLDEACNAKFESELHYERNISGNLSYGMINKLSGLQAQDLFLWFQVMSIRVDVPTSGVIYFDVGAASKHFPLSLFETPPECVAVSTHHHQEPDQRGRLRYKLDQGTSGRDVL
ncbi:hypothetical protein VNO78_16044 [Psophocarpus tetragonolobus]|uniref:Uncharacterized protein n=1 Tax=Psophocarpus tetragonolobus TaxID=3891 RepID=A0AAN9SHK5_PSOTE